MKKGIIYMMFLLPALVMLLVGVTTVTFAAKNNDNTLFKVVENSSSLRNKELRESQPVVIESVLDKNIMAVSDAPQVPGDTEILNDVFREPIGTGPALLTEKILQITPADKSQNGAIWSKEKIDLQRDFRIKAYLYLGDSFGDAADGITFTLQNDARMATNEKLAIGDSGMGMGAYSNALGKPYVRNALSIEFDTYYNSGPSNRMDREIDENGNRGHVAIVTPKANNNNYTGEHSALTLSPDYLSNGEWREIEFTWVASTKTLSYDIVDVGKASYVIQDLETKFGGSQVYWGFTGSTGAFKALNLIAISELPQKVQNIATVTNTTIQEGPSTHVHVNKGDQVALETDIITSTFVNPTEYDLSRMDIQLPAGIDPNLDEVQVEGNLIPRENLVFENGILTINNIELSRSGQTNFKVTALVTSEEYGGILEADFTFYDVNNMLIAKSNLLKIEILKPKTGDLILNYVNEKDEQIQASKKITGEIGAKYEETPPEIIGYKWIKTIGESNGYFQESQQVITFKYAESYFNLKQKVTKNDGEFALEASINDTLHYEITLESLFSNESDLGQYKNVEISENVPEYLEEISDMKLVTKSGQEVGTVREDKTTATIIGEVNESVALSRKENIILSFKAKIKKSTMGGTLLTVKAEAKADYNDGMSSPKIESNEVVTEVAGSIDLVNAPKEIDFGSVNITEFKKMVGVDSTNISTPLLVTDTRKEKHKWDITAQIEKEMTNSDDVQTGALKYILDKKEMTLSGSAKIVYANDGSSKNNQINISNEWGSGDLSDGLKLKIDSNNVPKTTGSYEGIIKWTLRETIE
ncbi:MAG: lectin-like domain-containing protein [Vagococcus salmoninarum]|uniref:lectin-like domain-containing protein n=1 Tax=Vagococcus salmoninarum TaxID=2739 RepID=UPI003F9C233B